MARIVMDTDDALLAGAAEIFGTTTKAATVNAALEHAVERRRGREFLDRLAGGGPPDRTGPVDTDE